MEENNPNQTNTPPVQNPASVETIQPEPPKPKFKLPILILGIIGLLVLAGGAAGFYFFVKEPPYRSKESCEKKTGRICNFTCGAPSGSTFETPVCSDLKKEWYPTIASVSERSLNKLVPSPTPPPAGGPTANWQIYNNEKYGFQLKYPPTWRVINEKTNDLESPEAEKTILTPDEECLNCGGFRSGIHIYIKHNRDNLTANEYVEKLIQEAGAYPPTPYIIQNEENYLEGLDAVMADGFIGAGFPGPEVFVNKGGYIINIASDTLNNALVYQILSTFKFVE